MTGPMFTTTAIPAHTGKMLQEHYDDYDSAIQLVFLGAMSGVRETAKVSDLGARSRVMQKVKKASDFLLHGDIIGMHSYVYLFYEGRWYGTSVSDKVVRPVSVMIERGN